MINTEYMDHSAISATVDTMQHSLLALLKQRNINDPAMIGIHTGGVWIARKLHSALGLKDPLGVLDISFYRDDFTRIGLNPRVKPSSIDFEVENRDIILVDDVIQSGRTIRAAMNEIFDFGRPASILLVCLVNRYGRELPVQPEVAGSTPDLHPDQHIRLDGPDNLSLTISTAKETLPREQET